MAQHRLFKFSLCAIAISMALVGCGGGDKKAESASSTAKAANSAPAEKITPVGVLVAQSQPIENFVELSGRASAYEISEVRPQATGVILKRYFQEGSFVKAGQPLYQLDNRTTYANAENAQANVVRHQANVQALKVKEQRYRQLVGTNAISKQEYDDIVASLRVAEADLKASMASLNSAKVSLDFSTIKAPISGIIGSSKVTTGALVTNGQADALVTIQRLDPIYIDINQSSAEWLSLRQQISQGELGRSGNINVKLKLEDGTIYPHAGQLTFQGATVNQSTGSITWRAIFPNPHQLLLPGMYATAQISQGVIPRGYLVPQSAVTRTPTGQAIVMVVNQDSTVSARPVTTHSARGNDWVISEGLNEGDKIVVTGNAKIKEGDKVDAQPMNSQGTASEPTEQAKAENTATAPTTSAPTQNTQDGKPTTSEKAELTATAPAQTETSNEQNNKADEKSSSTESAPSDNKSADHTSSDEKSAQ